MRLTPTTTVVATSAYTPIPADIRRTCHRMPTILLIHTMATILLLLLARRIRIHILTGQSPPMLTGLTMGIMNTDTATVLLLQDTLTTIRTLDEARRRLTIIMIPMRILIDTLTTPMTLIDTYVDPLPMMHTVLHTIAHPILMRTQDILISIRIVFTTNSFAILMHLHMNMRRMPTTTIGMGYRHRQVPEIRMHIITPTSLICVPATRTSLIRVPTTHTSLIRVPTTPTSLNRVPATPTSLIRVPATHTSLVRVPTTPTSLIRVPTTTHTIIRRTLMSIRHRWRGRAKSRQEEHGTSVLDTNDDI